ncbi:MAG: hypothetical protein HY290_28680 [Planctomycetia bacterium]|nr:hypothetical protein [Planctomycetia bacterium]
MKRIVQSRQATSTRRGIVLWEAAVSSLLVGLVLLTATQTLATSVRMQTAASERARANALANALVCEILEQSYMEPGQTSSAIGRESGELATSRANFDDVDDYHGWTDTPPQFKDGSTMSNFTGWQRQVAVEWVALTTLTQSPGSASETGMKRITVTVIHNSKTIITRVATKANASS